MLKGKLIYIFLLFSFLSFGQSKMLLASIQQASSGSFSPVNRPTYLSTGTPAEGTAVASIAPSVPSGSNGELLLLQVATFSDDLISDIPGWTTRTNRRVTDDGGTGTGTLFVAERFRDGTEGATVTVSATGNFGNSVVGVISSFSNVDSTLVFENAATTQMTTYDTTTATGTGIPLAGVSAATYDNSLAVTVGHFGDTRTVSQAPANYTTQGQYSGTSLGADAAIFLYYVSVDASGTVSQDAIYFDQISKTGGSYSFILIGTE